LIFSLCCCRLIPSYAGIALQVKSLPHPLRKPPGGRGRISKCLLL